MPLTRVDPSLFRLRVFAAGWLGELIATEQDQLAAVLFEEALRWVTLGQRVGYFAQVDFDVPGPKLSPSLCKLFFDYQDAAAVPSLPGVSAFGSELLAAQEDLSQDRLEYLRTLLFSDSQTWQARLGALKEGINLVGTVEPVPVDAIAWAVTGPETDLVPLDWSPARWRSAQSPAINEFYVERCLEVDRLRWELVRRTLSPEEEEVAFDAEALARPALRPRPGDPHALASRARPGATEVIVAPSVSAIRHELQRIAIHGARPDWIADAAPRIMALSCVERFVPHSKRLEPYARAQAVREMLQAATREMPREEATLVSIILGLEPEYCDQTLVARRTIAGQRFRPTKRAVTWGTIRSYYEPRALQRLAEVLSRLEAARA